METRIQIVAIVATAGLFVLVFELVRRRRLMERYALLWLFSTAVLLGLAVWKDLLERSPRRSASSTRRRRCSSSRSGSSSCCCCTSRSSSRAWPTRTRCSRSSVGLLQQRVDDARGRAAPARREPRRARAGRADARRADMAATDRARGRRGLPRQRRRRRPRRSSALRAQLRPGDELVVVDNASRDGTRDGRARRDAAATRRRDAANLGFAGGCHVGRAPRRARRCCCSSTPTPCPRRAASTRCAPRAAERPEWGAWQALVTLAGGEHVNTAGNVVHWLGFGWAGRHRASRSPTVDGAPARGRLRLGRRAGRAPRGVGRGRRLRRALLHVRRGPRPLAAPAPGGLGRRRRAGGARRARLRASPRATTSGSTSSATAGGRCSASTRARAARAARARRCSPSRSRCCSPPGAAAGCARSCARRPPCCAACRRCCAAAAPCRRTRRIAPRAFADAADGLAGLALPRGCGAASRGGRRAAPVLARRPGGARVACISGSTCSSSSPARRAAARRMRASCWPRSARSATTCASRRSSTARRPPSGTASGATSPTTPWCCAAPPHSIGVAGRSASSCCCRARPRARRSRSCIARPTSPRCTVPSRAW